MNAMIDTSERYGRCIAASKRIRWDIDADVIRGRRFDLSKPFLPDGLSGVSRLGFLSEQDARLLSQVQGRTYAYLFGLVERFINAKILEVGRQHWFGDQTKLEALVRFSEEELKHQELFRRLEALAAAGMPAGYRMTADPNEVAQLVLSKSTWAVLALTCHIELFTQVHYKESIDPNGDICPLWKDVFLHHWKEESQHATLDELEWEAEDARLSVAERDQGVTDLLALVGAVDGLLQAQAAADAEYFLANADRYTPAQQQAVRDGLVRAYRHQYIVSGVGVARFQEQLFSKLDDAQRGRVMEALAPLLA